MVLNDGIAEQIGTPLDLYDTPKRYSWPASSVRRR